MGVSNKAVMRLSLYRSALQRFKAYGAAYVYSCDIAATLGLTAAQVRKDFSLFKLPGKKKVGYSVERLLGTIDLILRKNEPHRVVLCGASPSALGLLAGQAGGFTIAAAFDEPSNHGALRGAGVPVLPLEALTQYVNDNGIDFGIIASPEKTAQRMLDLLVCAGIKGVINLSNAELKSPRRCVVASISVAREFEKIVYCVNNLSARQRG